MTDHETSRIRITNAGDIPLEVRYGVTKLEPLSPGHAILLDVAEIEVIIVHRPEPDSFSAELHDGSIATIYEPSMRKKCTTCGSVYAVSVDEHRSYCAPDPDTGLHDNAIDEWYAEAQ